MMMRKMMMVAALAVCSSACITSGPQSASKFVKMPQDAPAGKVTASAALGVNIAGEGEDTSAGGFSGEGYMARYSEGYDWSVGVSNSALFYDANANLVTGKTRFGILHGIGLNVGYTDAGDDSVTAASISPTAGLFFQRSVDSLHHFYGSLRGTYSYQATSEDLPDSADQDRVLLTGTFGYAIMDGREGLSIYPELMLNYDVDAEDFALGIGFSMAANFL